jgi:hypothetical protein
MMVQAGAGTGSIGQAMPDWVRSCIFLVMGVVVTISGVLLWRHSEAAAAFFARPGRRMFGDGLADRTYTSANVRWGAGGWVVFGVIALVSGDVGLVQTLT